MSSEFSSEFLNTNCRIEITEMAFERDAGGLTTLIQRLRDNGVHVQMTSGTFCEVDMSLRALRERLEKFRAAQDDAKLAMMEIASLYQVFPKMVWSLQNPARRNWRKARRKAHIKRAGYRGSRARRKRA